MTVRLNIYFIHAKWLKDREKVIQELRKLITKYVFKGVRSVKTQVISDFDPNDITGDVIAKHVSYTPIPEGGPEGENLTFYNMFLRNLHIFQLSNSLKHFKALQEIAADSGDDDVNIILEDDVLYEDKICISLERLMEELPKTNEVFFLGLPSNDSNTTKQRNTKFLNTKEVFRVFPYNDAYIVNKKTAQLMVDNFLPIKFINNIQLSFVMEKAKINSKLITPNIFMDGSKFGVFLSTLNANNQLLFNNEYMFARTVTLKDNPTLEEKQNVEKLFNNSPLNGHPDFIVVKALYNIKQKNYIEAQKMYDSALKIYQGNACIINHESQFLKEYLRSFKLVQDPELVKFV